MSFSIIPTITPSINISRVQVVNLLLASVALEELGLAHIINTEGEKIEAVLGTLSGISIKATSISGLLSVNREVRRTLQTVIKSQMLLQFKLEDILDIPVMGTRTFIAAGSAWGAGTPYGQGNAQYTTLASTEAQKTVVLGLGNNNIPVGTVQLLRQGNFLLVTFTTNYPYVMNLLHLYVSNTVPPSSAPGSFPYKYPADGNPITDPNSYLTTYTFTVNISIFSGQTLYIAAHAHILQAV